MKTNIKQKINGIWQLNWVNFFMSDMMAGIGPFLGIFLLAHGWQTSLIGTVMTIGGIAGILMTAPSGALVDASTHKRWLVIIPGVLTVLASGSILYSQSFWFVTASQILTAIAGSAVGPAVIGITLGIVGQKYFNKQNGINQAYNHAGNVAGAALSGYLGMKYGMPAIFLLAALFGILSIISVLMIPDNAIDNRIARGLNKQKLENEKISGVSILFKKKELLILAACLACFHLGNGAMLPLYGMAAATNKVGNASMFVAMTIVIAQLVMVVASLVAMRMAENKGYWIVLLISFIALPVRGFIASHMISNVGIYPVQMLDGVGAGLQSVAVPGLVAKILNGSGRINVGQGAIMTVQGAGASLSPALGGWMVHFIGYGKTFLILGCFALISILLWSIFYKPLKECCKP